MSTPEINIQKTAGVTKDKQPAIRNFHPIEVAGTPEHLERRLQKTGYLSTAGISVM